MGKGRFNPQAAKLLTYEQFYQKLMKKDKAKLKDVASLKRNASKKRKKVSACQKSFGTF